MSSVFIFTIKDPVYTGKDIFLNGQKLAQIFSRFIEAVYKPRRIFLSSPHRSERVGIIKTESARTRIPLFHISHNAPYLPPKFCLSIAFNFSCDGCKTQDKWKTKVMQNLGGGGGQLRRIMGNVEVACSLFLKSHVFQVRLRPGEMSYDVACSACSRLSVSGEDAKVKGTRNSSSRFLNSAGPTISEPGTG